MKNIGLEINFLHRSFIGFLPGRDALFSYFMVLPNGVKQSLRLEVGELVGIGSRGAGGEMDLIP